MTKTTQEAIRIKRRVPYYVRCRIDILGFHLKSALDYAHRCQWDLDKRRTIAGSVWDACMVFATIHATGLGQPALSIIQKVVINQKDLMVDNRNLTVEINNEKLF